MAFRSLLSAGFVLAFVVPGALAETTLPQSDPRATADALRNTVGLWIGSAAKDGILRDIASQPWNTSWGESFIGVTYSRRLTRFQQHFTLDAEVGGGARYGETDSQEAWGAIYLRFDGFPWRNRLYTSVGVSTGLHWMNPLPIVETGPAGQRETHTSKWLHYFSPELAFSLPSAPEHEVAIRYAHRSGVFGAFNGVWEGSNVLMIGYRRRF